VIARPETSIGAAPGASFQGLGLLDGGFTEAADVSADGSVVIGQARIHKGFVWTQLDGLASVGDLAGGSTTTNAMGISADGSIIVGQGSSANGFEAYRRTSDGMMIGLGDLPGGSFSSFASDISADGSIIVGAGNNGTLTAVRWTEATGFQSLGYLEAVQPLSAAIAISGDGSTITGIAVTDIGQEAFRWTSSTGMQSIHSGPAGSQTLATDISFDGSVIVGQVIVDYHTYRAFRWTQADGLTWLPDLPNMESGVAEAISGDGSLIGGWNATVAIYKTDAVLWIDGTPRSFQNMLANDFGLSAELNGWQLISIDAISADQHVFVGSGYAPDGGLQAWRAVITIPEPSRAKMCFSALACVAFVRLRARTAA
jgi:uncharacterized membrane protein